MSALAYELNRLVDRPAPKLTAGVLAYRAARSAGASPMDAAAIAFRAEALHEPHDRLKRETRRSVKAGPHDRENQARYGYWAGFIRDNRLDLDGALVVISRKLGDERAAHKRREISNGRSLRPRLDMLVLSEVRLALRLLRARHAALPEIIDGLTLSAPLCVAAE